MNRHSYPYCPYCGSHNCDIRFSGRESDEASLSEAFLITDSAYHSYPDIFICRECELIFSDPYAGTAEALPYYKQMKDPHYHDEAEGRSKPFRKILCRLEKQVNKGRLLDIGAATGIFLHHAQRRGWDVSGVEPSQWAVQFAHQTYGLNIFCGTVEEAPFSPHSFDAIVLLDVLEHVRKPLVLLQKIKSLLTPQGMLVLTTPDIGSVIATLLGPKWWHIRRAHQYYFTEKTLLRLLDRADFMVVERKRYPWAFSLHYWFSRFEHFSPAIYRLLDRFESTPQGKQLSKKVVMLNFFDSFEWYIRPLPSSTTPQ